MDRVGVEATTSAMPAFSRQIPYLSKGADMEREQHISHPHQTLLEQLNSTGSINPLFLRVGIHDRGIFMSGAEP
jgi:hypothetical protein